MAPRTRAERQAELMAQEPEKREPTAVEQLQALAEQRHANDGYLVPRPHLQMIADFWAWLQKVAEVGGSGDVEIAWHYVNNREWKEKLLNQYEQLRDAAGRRHFRLMEQAEAEERAASVAYQERTAKANKARRKASLMAQLAAIEAQE